MLRSTGPARYLGVIALSAGCGGAPPPGTTQHAQADPLPVSDNQQGRAAPVEVEEVPSAVATTPIPSMPEQPSIAGVYLWCNDRAGRACALASAALGTGPKDISGLPTVLLTVEDRTNDCDEPTIAAVSNRLDAAFAVELTGWRDQSGNYLDTSLLAEMYQAGGCINDANPAAPVAKISAGDGADPRVYLVRVWDSQPAGID